MDTRSPATDKSLKRTIKSFATEGTLVEALAKISILADAKLVVDWRGLEAAGVGRHKHVRVSVAKARAGQLLDLVLARVAVKGKPLGWYIHDGKVIVTTQWRALHRGRLSAPLGKATRTAAAITNANLDEIPLGDVIRFFRELTQLNFHVNWRALKQVGVTAETPVTLRVSNVSAAKMLDLVVSGLTSGTDKYQRVYWLVDGGVVLVSTGSALNTRTRTRTYALGSLLLTPPEVPMPTGATTGNVVGTSSNRNNSNRSSGAQSSRSGGGSSNLRAGRNSSSGGSDSRTSTSGAEQRQQTVDTITDIIINAIGQEMWQPAGKGSVRVVRNRLVVTQTLLGFKLLDESLRRR